MAKKKDEEAPEAPTPLNRMVKSGQVRVRALAHLAEEDEDGKPVHRAPGEEFTVSAERRSALGPNLVEDAK